MSKRRVVVTGNIKSGMLELLDKNCFRRALQAEFPEDTIVDVVIERQSKKRSNQQNKYLFGVCYPLIAEHTGYTEDEIHAILKHKFLQKHFTIGEEEYDVGVTTRELTTAEFNEYCEKIRRWAATVLSVSVPEPNEENLLDLLNEHLDIKKV